MFILKFVYTVFSFILLLGLAALIVHFKNTKTPFLRSLFYAILVAIIVIPSYLVFIFISNKQIAVILDSIYFIGNTWMAFFIFRFSFEYTELYKRVKNYVKFYILACLLDSLSFIVNYKLNNVFDITYIAYGSTDSMYWSLSMHKLYYVHLLLCYIMVSNSLGALLLASIKAPLYYKRKYISVLTAYFIVIVVNFICYTRDYPIDFAVILYGLIAVYITYYSAFRAPFEMINKILGKVCFSIDVGLIYYDKYDNCIFINPYIQHMTLKGIAFNSHIVENYLISQRNKLENRDKQFAVWKDIIDFDGESRFYDIEYKQLFYEGFLIGTYLKFSDTTEEHRKLEKQIYIATHDSLTGLYNREYFFDKCNELLKATPTVERYMVASNVKDFKLINEIFGSENGDKIIKALGESLRKNCREDDIYGRIGEDKFALLIRKDLFDFNIFEENISIIRRLITKSDYNLRITFGICAVHGNIEKAQLLYDKANIANKTIATNYQKSFAFYDSELIEKMLVEKNIIADFATAIRSDQFELHFQPVFNKIDKLKGVEALVYWNHPTFGLQKPDFFLEVLEKSALIHILDAYVLENSIKLLKKWQDEGRTDLFVSVNISTKDIYYMDIYETVTELVEKYGVNPNNLYLEFKETLLTSDFVTAKILLKKLRDYGIRTGIDNFGRGYSSLNLIKDVKTNFLKIDMVFLSETENSDRSVKILKFIVSLAKTLDMNVISQGVETDEQYEILHKLDCDFMQGYYYSTPLNGVELEEKISKS